MGKSGGKSGVSSSFWGGNPVSVHHSGGKSGVSSSFWGKSGGEIRCQFIILARGEIRCQFIILARGEIRCQFIILARKGGGKSGVSSSFLPEKGGEIRCQFIILARKDELTPDLPPKRRTDTGFTPRKDELTPDLPRHRIYPPGFTPGFPPGFPPVLSSSQTRMPGLGWRLNRSFATRALVVNRNRNLSCGFAARCSTAQAIAKTAGGLTRVIGSCRCFTCSSRRPFSSSPKPDEADTRSISSPHSSSRVSSEARSSHLRMVRSTW